MRAVKQLIAVLVCSLTVVSFAAENGSVQTAGQPSMKGRFLQNLQKDLNLSDEQVQKIENIHKDAQKQNRQNREKAQNEDFKAFFSAEPDSKAFDKVAKKVADAAAENAKTNIMNLAETRKKVYAVLNKEQKAQFLVLTEQRQAKRAQVKGKKPAVE
jgi:Spy/CpxP family protein refolding chaperone